MRLMKRISDWERDLRAHYNSDLSTPENRRRVRIYNLWFDHAILRTVWTNFYRIAEGVYRSNHPTHARFVKMKAMGIKSVLNLRGSFGAAHYLVEQESCQTLGLDLVSINLQARHAPPGEEILDMIDAFRKMQKPLVMHCKSGADRAGFAAALYLLVIEKRPMSEARKQLSIKYLHLKFSKTGVLDHILDVYEARNARERIDFEDWVREEYEFMAMQADYLSKNKPMF